MQDSGQQKETRAGRLRPIQVGVVNHSSLTRKEVQQGMAVLQCQVDEDFGHVWNVDARLELLPQTKPKDNRYRDYWALILLDSEAQIASPNSPPPPPSARPRQLGYHDVTSAGLPLAKVFVGTTEKERKDWVHTASHELLEMLADPDLSQVVLVHPDAPRLRIYAREVCDPVKPLAYEKCGMIVSDFVYPAWFSPSLPVPASPLHRAPRNDIIRPLELARGGYIGFLDLATSTWSILVKDKLGKETETDLGNDPDALGTLGSRNERRTIPRNRWVTSALDWAP
jgi:hypothetical protein